MPSTKVELLPVTQAVRNAAAEFELMVGRITERDAANIRAGEWDSTKDIQWFARLLSSTPIVDVTRVEKLREALGDKQEWIDKRNELYDWTGSAWLAGEEKDQPPEGLKAFLHSLIGYLISGEEASAALDGTRVDAGEGWAWYAGTNGDHYDVAGPCDTLQQAIEAAEEQVPPGDYICVIEAVASDDGGARIDFAKTRNECVVISGFGKWGPATARDAGAQAKYADMEAAERATAMADDRVGDPWELLAFFREKLRQAEDRAEHAKDAAITMAMQNPARRKSTSTGEGLTSGEGDGLHQSAAKYARICNELADQVPVAGEPDALWWERQSALREAAVLLSHFAASPSKPTNASVREALTPSGDTKAAYSGEFKFDVMFPSLDEDDDEPVPHPVTVPWETIKQIMAAISTRAALDGTRGDAGEAFTGVEAWDELVNVDDRTSPEEYPDMCLITRDELIEFMQRAASTGEGLTSGEQKEAIAFVEGLQLAANRVGDHRNQRICASILTALAASPSKPTNASVREGGE